MANRLSKESSPYLLQHQHNPVDWFPWGKEALEKAQKEDKPIFLSIGYSSCHWCHVMAHEAFESREIAEYLNAHFVSIKVDREERPDLDALYMRAALLLNGQGGWPLNAFLLPDKHPFFIGTYFPVETKYGMPGFLELLEQINDTYQNKREQVREAARQLADMLHEQPAAAKPLSDAPLQGFAREFVSQFDSLHGGFRGSPKFVPTLSFLLLLQQKEMDKVLFSLRKIGMSGLHDHLGGGFFRYSTDERWEIPHFEKMLYDNALLLQAYSLAYGLSNDPFFRDRAEGIVRYVSGTLQGKAYYASQDADSEGEEGKYYVFTHDEIMGHVIHQKEFRGAFSISPHGNFEGKNHLHATEPIPDLLHEDLQLLTEYRKRRVAPAVDAKHITAWNGLMIAGMAMYGRYCGVREAIAEAEEVMRYILSFSGIARIVGGNIPGFLEDYAAVAWALAELHVATGKEEYRSKCIKTIDAALERFYDGKRLFSYGKSNPDLVVQISSDEDNVMPSGMSMLLWSMVQSGEERYLGIVRDVLEQKMAALEREPMGYPFLLQVLSRVLQKKSI
ncbi:thioredoxin domain-containing protein [Candidatus Woesearchaeota archaeon]|nr:thioredoxin domain-containing protein [Candidatus Woesearchaeota archaeon]